MRLHSHIIDETSCCQSDEAMLSTLYSDNEVLEVLRWCLKLVGGNKIRQSGREEKRRRREKNKQNLCCHRIDRICRQVIVTFWQRICRRRIRSMCSKCRVPAVCGLQLLRPQARVERRSLEIYGGIRAHPASPAFISWCKVAAWCVSYLN